MNKRRKFRPSVDGMEQRLALNAAGAAGVLVHHATAVVDVKHMKTPHHHHTPAPHGGHVHHKK